MPIELGQHLGTRCFNVGYQNRFGTTAHAPIGGVGAHALVLVVAHYFSVLHQKKGANHFFTCANALLDGIAGLDFVQIGGAVDVLPADGAFADGGFGYHPAIGKMLLQLLQRIVLGGELLLRETGGKTGFVARELKIGHCRCEEPQVGR